jgi:hypothetical protein
VARIGLLDRIDGEAADRKGDFFKGMNVHITVSYKNSCDELSCIIHRRRRQ